MPDGEQRRGYEHDRNTDSCAAGQAAVVEIPLARPDRTGDSVDLDGLEVTIVGSVAARLSESGSGIAVTPADIGTAAAFYVAGACLGALFFGQLTDRFGRKKLFVLTLAVYVAATVATAFAFSPWYFFVARFVRERASAVSTRRSTPRSTSSSPLGCVAGSIL